MATQWCGAEMVFLQYLAVKLFHCRQRGTLSKQDDAAVELHGFHAQLHDSVPRALRGVDRVDVGLYVGRLQSLRAFLPCHSGDRQPGGERRVHC